MGATAETTPRGSGGPLGGSVAEPTPGSAGSTAGRGPTDPLETVRAVGALALDPAAEEIVLPSHPRSAGAARRVTLLQLRTRWMLPAELTDDAVLLVSELVGNAVRHAGADGFGLRFRRRRGWLRVEVRDPSRALPCLLP
ncbi:ATP-binding protein, partial [Streptomyces alkaliphilus]